MTRSDYSEDQMLQQGTAEFFREHLGWETVFAFDAEDYGPDSLLGRAGPHEAVLARELRAALAELNSGAPAEAVEEAVRQVVQDDTGKRLEQLNEEKYRLIRDGVTVQAANAKGEQDTFTLRLVDFAEPARNRFLMVRELWLTGPLGQRRRCDLVGFVNGLPLLFLELKRYDKGVKLAFDKNLTDYKQDIRHLFFCNAFAVLSNGHDARFGSITSPWEHFYRWRRLNEDDPMPPKEQPLLQTLLRGMCSKGALLDIVQNFILFDRSEGETAKIIARNHQYLGVNRVVERLKHGGPEVEAGRLGVFWHTQGSGKSYSMVFLAEKILRTVSGKYSFLVVTDRLDLDGQIAKTFAACGAVADARKARIPDSDSVAARLATDARIQFCLVQKFRERVLEPYTLRDDVIVLSDEAHRTQYGRLAMNMRQALKNAKFLGFTGTPLIDKGEKQLTRQVFGDYVSIYDFQRAVEDDSTVKLYYLSRGNKLAIEPDIQRRLEERIEAARAAGELDEDQEEKIYRKLAQEYPIVTSDTRLDSVAQDLVGHYADHWRSGKAMLVCWDKLTCGRMYAFIQKRWQERLADLEARYDQEAALLAAKGKAPGPTMAAWRQQIAWMKETEICVVISGADSKELAEEYRKYGLDLSIHRDKLAKRELDEDFKRAGHPFRLVIVCAMWLTGFDVKSLATLYLDKPMQGHTLMQAVARVNRVYKGKDAGWVVDYNGMIKSLRRALSSYAKGDGGGDEGYDPLRDDSAALAEYAASVAKARDYLAALGFDLAELAGAGRLEKLEPIARAVSCVKKHDESKATFNVLVEDMRDKFLGLFPHPGLGPYDAEHSALEAVYNKANEAKASVDVSDILRELYDVVDTSVKVLPPMAQQPRQPYDLSRIDFERLRQEFDRSPYKQAVTYDLKQRIEARLVAMLRENPARADFLRRFEEIIRDYNRDKDDAEIARIFERLMALDKDLDAEQRRFVREGFDNDAQLAIFDMLRKETLAPAEIGKLKKAAKELLPILEQRALLAEHWRERASSRAEVETAILDYFWSELPDPAYAEAEIRQLSERVFRHLLDKASPGTYLH